MRAGLAVALVLFSGLSEVRAQQGAPRFFDEISRLEYKKAKSELDSQSKQKLSELYFLTSRCADLLALYSDDEKRECMLCCACGVGCSETTSDQSVAKLQRFSATLQLPKAAWANPQVQALWSDLKTRPEAKYIALRFFRTHGAKLSKSEVLLRQKLEKELGLLEKGVL